MRLVVRQWFDSLDAIYASVHARTNLGSAVREQNICLDSNGRANNWAMGFCSSARELEAGRGLFHSGGCEALVISRAYHSKWLIWPWRVQLSSRCGRRWSEWARSAACCSSTAWRAARARVWGPPWCSTCETPAPPSPSVSKTLAAGLLRPSLKVKPVGRLSCSVMLCGPVLERRVPDPVVQRRLLGALPHRAG